MKLLIVTLCVLAALIPAALSIECYVCRGENGNCETGKKTCPSGNDQCIKVKKDDKVMKECGNNIQCDGYKKRCESQDCEAYCCKGDLCNGSVPLKPVTFLTLLAMALAVAKYLM